MTTSSPPLTNQLELLEHADLIRRAHFSAGLEYLFRHGLTQEAAYDSLLRNERRRLHRLVAETLERDEAARGDLALRLAQHWDQAGEARRAFDYYAHAGEHAAHVYADAEALMAYDRAVALAEELGLSSAQRLPVYAPRGRVLELRGAYTEALAAYQSLQTLAQTEGDRATELQALIHQATLYATPTNLFDLEKGETLSQRALDMARAIGDRAAEAKVLWNLSLAKFFGNNNLEAIQYGQASASIARELNLREQLAYTLNDLARPYIFTGQGDKALEAMVEAESLWRELHNLPMLADNLIGRGMLSLLTGVHHPENSPVEEGLAISCEIGNLWGQSYAHEALGLLYAQAGEMDRALHHFGEAAQLGAQVNYLDAQYQGRLVGALVYRLLGAPDKARELVEHLLAKADPPRGWLSVPYAFLAMLEADAGNLEAAHKAILQGETEEEENTFSLEWTMVQLASVRVLLAEGRLKAALDTASTTITRMRANGLHPFRATLLYYQALALEQLDRDNDALIMAEAARSQAEETADRYALWEVYALLARLYAGRGEAERAAEMKRRARAEIEFLSDHAPPDLRASFRNRPEVRALLDE